MTKPRTTELFPAGEEGKQMHGIAKGEEGAKREGKGGEE